MLSQMEMRGFFDGAQFSSSAKSTQYSKLSSKDQDEDEDWGAEAWMSTASTPGAGVDNYNEYLDDDELKEALQADFQLPTPPVLSKRGRNSLIAGVVTLVLLVFFMSGGSAPEEHQENDSEATTPIVYDSGLTSVLRMSVSSRENNLLHEPREAATAVLVHNADTGNVELQMEHHSTRTVVVGGMAYISAVRPAATDGHLSLCTPVQHIPGAAVLIQLLSHARGSLSAWVQQAGKPVMNKVVPGVDCAGTLWHVRSHGEDALVCITENRIVEVTTQHMSIEVHSHVETTDGSPIVAPECENQDEEPPAITEEVDMWAGNSTVAPWFVITGSPVDGDVTAPSWDEDNTPAPAASDTPKNATKDCVFIHGVGHTPVPGSAPILVGSFPYYWGKVHEVVSQCRSKVFLNVETMYRGWDNTTLQQQVCAAATYDPATKKSSMGLISDRIVFTHSMGNMMLAGAIQKGVCHLDSSSSWYEVSGPMRGSAMASKLAEICSQKGTYKYVAAKLGYCTPDGVAPAYNSLEPGYPGLDGIAATIAARLSGAMCGTSAYGLASVYSVEMSALSNMAGFADMNDGVVPWSSCDTKGSVQFSHDYHDKFYAAAVNHIDSACYEGDGLWGLDRKPCSWYSLRD